MRVVYIIKGFVYGPAAGMYLRPQFGWELESRAPDWGVAGVPLAVSERRGPR